jgi:dimethylargininase
MTRVALTRAVSASLAQCQLTYLDRTPIDLDRARQQHAAYEALLSSLGWRIVRLPTLDDQPDAVFVEDAGIALDEVAILAPMGAASRAGESATVEDALSRFLPIDHLEPPAMLDGGDVLRAGRRLFVGISGRTNAAAVDQLGRLLDPYEYEVIPVSVEGALHLKSACSFLGDNSLLANAEWFDLRPFAGMAIVPVEKSEAWAASVLCIDGHVVIPSGFPRTAQVLSARGLCVDVINLDELRKAEGGPTCLSILLPRSIGDGGQARAV